MYISKSFQRTKTFANKCEIKAKFRENSKKFRIKASEGNAK